MLPLYMQDQMYLLLVTEVGLRRGSRAVTGFATVVNQISYGCLISDLEKHYRCHKWRM